MHVIHISCSVRCDGNQTVKGVLYGTVMTVVRKFLVIQRL